jgi:hypothetical protein
MSKAKKSTPREKLLKEARAEIAARLEEPANAATVGGAAEGGPVATESAGTPVPPTSGTTGGKGGKGKKGKAPKPKASKPPKAKKARKPGCLDAAAAVLAAAKGPMNCKDIVDAALKRGLWETSGKTPHSTLYAAVIRDIAAKGKASRFRKTERGMFAAA